jgi:hypothetical protein
MVVVPAFAALYVVDPATGEVLYANDLGKSIYGAATIANGRVFVGDTGGRVHAFGLPARRPVDCPTAGLLAKAGLRFRHGVGTFTLRVEQPSPGAPLSRMSVRLPRGLSAPGRLSRMLRVRAKGLLLSRRRESLRRGVLRLRLPRGTRSVRLRLTKLRASGALRRRLHDGRARTSARVRAIDALGASHALRPRFTAYGRAARRP